MLPLLSLSNLLHLISLLSLFFRDWAQRILGYVKPRWIVEVHPPKTGKRRTHLWLHLEEPLNWDSLRAALWCNWPSNASFEECSPWKAKCIYVCKHDWHFSVTPLAGFPSENLLSPVVSCKGGPKTANVFFFFFLWQGPDTGQQLTDGRALLVTVSWHSRI